MGDDWIKMRVDIYRDPKVSVIAMALHDPTSPLSRYVDQMNQCDMSVTRNVMRNAAVGALISVWGVARHRGKRVGDDLVLYGACLKVVDDIADLPGFGMAMEEAGWVVDDETGLVFPRFFEEFNVSPADQAKAKNAERQRRFREEKRNALRNVTVTLKSNAREEKRREEKSINTEPPVSPLGEQAQESKPAKAAKTPKAKKPTVSLETFEAAVRASATNPLVIQACCDWGAYKLDRGEAYLESAMRPFLTRVRSVCEAYGAAVFVESVATAIANGWKGWDHDLDKVNDRIEAQKRAKADRDESRRLTKPLALHGPLE